MATPKSLLNRLKKFDGVALLNESIKESDTVILNVNRSQLREKGEDNKGHALADYSAPYAKRKEKLSSYGLQSPRPDGYLTGEMQKSMSLEQQTEGIFDIISYAPHTKHFVNQYGLSVFGIQPNNLRIVKDAVYPKLMKKIRKGIGL